MGFLSIYDKTERLSLNDLDHDLDADYWVEVKPNLSTKAEEACYNILMQSPRWKGGEVEASARFPEYRREIAFWSLNGWNLTDADGKELVLPSLEEALRNSRSAQVRRDVIQQLPGYVLNAIMEAVNKANTRRDAKEQATFRGPDQGSLPAEQ